jgi:hypothetical protein
VPGSLNTFQQIAILPGLGACLIFLILLSLIAVVVLPAVWSRDAQRRTAALAVLRLLLRHWSEHRSSRPSRIRGGGRAKKNVRDSTRT